MPATKILILTDWYEPGYKAGGPIQSIRNFVAAMHETYDISVLTSDRDLGTSKAYDGIPSGKWISRDPGIRVYYAPKKSIKPSLLKRLISEKQPDFIYLNSLYSFHFSIMPMLLLRGKKISAKVVLAPRGMLRESAVNHKGVKKKLFIALLRSLHIPELMRFHATDEQEKKDIRYHFPKAGRIDLIPNFSAALPAGPGLAIKKNPGELRCVYISRIMPIKNIGFFLKVLCKLPEIRLSLDIFGDVEDDKYWQQVQKLLQAIPEQIEVRYHGSLPHEAVIKAIESYHLFVLPTLGENYGHAIFESFSAGRPALISDKTPWRGLQDLQIGWDLPLDNPDAWLAAVREAAAADQTLFESWTEKCITFARSRSDGPGLKNAYINLFS